MLILPKKSYKGVFTEYKHDMRFGALPEFNRKMERISNTLVKTGAEYILRTVFRGEAVLPANYYLGLTSASYSWTSTLAALAAGEPVGNGYARIALNRGVGAWTVQEVNGVEQALSSIVTFVCAGANWTQNWQRMFLTDQAAGVGGYVFAVSGPAPAPRVVTPGTGPSIQYTAYLRG